jgi:hypothetical protein
MAWMGFRAVKMWVDFGDELFCRIKVKKTTADPSTPVAAATARRSG